MDNDAFLKELQIQCLKDSLEYIHEFQEALAALTSATSETLTRLMKSCHSLKGNLQAVGYSYCGQLVHGLESALVSLCDTTGAPLAALSDMDGPILEFLLSDTIQSVEGYFADLTHNLSDSPELYEKRKQALGLVTGWKPSEETIALSVAQHMARETRAALGSPSPIVPAELFFPSTSPTGSNTPAETSLETSAAPTVSSAAIYLLCRQKERHFALPIENVLEILRSQPITELPLAPAHYLGALNLRGEVLPVIDLRATLGSSTTSGRGYIVVCHARGVKFGFPVEDAQQVIELKPNSFHSTAAMAGGPAGLVSHFALIRELTIQVLDIERVLVA